MKTKLATAFIFLSFLVTSFSSVAEEQNRKVDPFTEISLRIGATVHLEQGAKQNLEIVAKPSTLDEIITEVKDGKLIIRFPNKNYVWTTFQPGDITIYITTPEINGLGISGSGDIIAEDEKIIESTDSDEIQPLNFTEINKKSVVENKIDSQGVVAIF